MLGSPEEDFREAREYIVNNIVETVEPEQGIDLTSQFELSSSQLGEYVNLDWEHRNAIRKLLFQIRDYADDKSRRRPLNIIMQAEPGSGKSHFVKCLAKHRLLARTVGAVTYNMAIMQGLDGLAHALDAVRNLKVIDKTPILFLDEFDTDERNYPLLLPLMWDGEMNLGHRDLKTGKLIIILAGSTSKVHDMLAESKLMHAVSQPTGTKLVDLLSRINGGEFSVPPLDLNENKRDRRTDKVCIAISLLRHRYGETLDLVPWCLLNFVATAKFRYGVRSISHIIDLLPALSKKHEVQYQKLPLENVSQLKSSSLVHHLICDDGASDVVNKWAAACKANVAVRIAEEEKEIDF